MHTEMLMDCKAYWDPGLVKLVGALQEQTHQPPFVSCSGFVFHVLRLFHITLWKTALKNTKKKTKNMTLVGNWVVLQGEGSMMLFEYCDQCKTIDFDLCNQPFVYLWFHIISFFFCFFFVDVRYCAHF